MEMEKIVFTKEQELMLEELDPLKHDLMILTDIGEGKDKSVMSVYDVKADKYEFSAMVSEHNEILLRLSGWGELKESVDRLLNSCERFSVLVRRLCDPFKGMRRRKTTYKTIRRDCAKRNRHK